MERAQILSMDQTDLQALHEARAILENPGLAARLANVLGKPIEAGLKYLPDRFGDQVSKIVQKALLTSLKAALFTVGDLPGPKSPDLTHKIGVAATGGMGGFFGVAGLAVELPISTTIMMRAIATIAQQHGEELASPETRMACLEVFALGGKSDSDDSAEIGYYGVRNAMAGVMADAIRYFSIPGATVANRSAPFLVRLVARVAERFSIQVTEKAMAQAMPIVGAAGGATVNLLFIDHYQDMARGHFTVRRLERKYGPESVRELYDSLPPNLT